jgi:phosphopantetheinyl transferase
MLFSAEDAIRWCMNGKQAQAELNGTHQGLSEAGLRTAMAWQDIADGHIHMATLVADETSDIEQLLALLGESENNAAESFTDASERRHFVIRRAFQRAFVATICGWKGSPAKLPMVHQRDTRTSCEAAPEMMLSFSSSQNVYCACASKSHAIGIDVETVRAVENALALSRRFFLDDEASMLEAQQPEVRNTLFLKMWTAKEAGLKAQGLGVVDGLHRVKLSLDADGPHLRSENGWTLAYPSGDSRHIIAVIHRPLA